MTFGVSDLFMTMIGNGCSKGFSGYAVDRFFSRSVHGKNH